MEFPPIDDDCERLEVRSTSREPAFKAIRAAPNAAIPKRIPGRQRKGLKVHIPDASFHPLPGASGVDLLRRSN